MIPCPTTIIFNNCDQNNLLGDILNAGDNVDYQEDYGFTGSFSKIAPTIIDYCTKKKCLNMQLENFIPQRNIGKNDKKYDEIYQINIIDDKESDERDQISKNYEEKETADIEVLKLGKLGSQKKMTILRKNLIK